MFLLGNIAKLLPSDISSYKGLSDEFIDANVQLALTVARKLQESMQFKTRIVFPDKPEKRRVSEIFKTVLDWIDGISICSLDDVPGSVVSSFFQSIRDTLDFDFEDENEGRWESDNPLSLYIFLNCSTKDLPMIEKRNLLYQLPLSCSISSLMHYVLTSVFLGSQLRTYITDFFLNSYLSSIFEQESILRALVGDA